MIPTELIALLGQQRDLYLKLRELSDKQRSMIAGDQPELLLQHPARAPGFRSPSLARLNEELSPFRRNWDALYATLSEDGRTRASGAVAGDQRAAAGDPAADQEDGALLSARKQAVAADLTAASGGRTANTAYARQRGLSNGANPAADVTG